jgi:hypothetical protein
VAPCATSYCHFHCHPTSADGSKRMTYAKSPVERGLLEGERRDSNPKVAPGPVARLWAAPGLAEPVRLAGRSLNLPGSAPRRLSC